MAIFTSCLDLTWPISHGQLPSLHILALTLLIYASYIRNMIVSVLRLNHSG